MLDGELEWLTDGLEPRDGKTIHEQIEESGAPALLLERYAGRLRVYEPWRYGREVSLLFLGDEISAEEADELLVEEGLGFLRLVDNGIMHGVAGRRPRVPPDPARGVEGPRGRAPHAGARLRAGGVHRGRRLARGPRRRGGRRHVLARRQRDARRCATRQAAIGNVRVAEASHGAGVYEAVITTLAEQ